MRRDAGVHAVALKRVEDAARGGENLMPRIVAAVEAYATVGEIADVLRGVFGEYRETVVV
jgi:methylmalonyl-CoA mutase N-terminal domain/subunit